ncbi:MAG: hypothetical protein ACYDCT_02375 [Dehalococcoidia bacterium]
MRASTSGSHTLVVSGDRRVDEANLMGDLNGRSTVPAPHADPFARLVAIAHARALLIYLKHRGVLNVEEFRRTHGSLAQIARSIDVSDPAAK